MNLSKALTFASVALGGIELISGLTGKKEGKETSISDVAGFVKKGVQAYGKASAKDGVFAAAPEVRPRTVKELTRGTPAVSPTLAAAQPTYNPYSRPEIQTAMSNLLQNARNQQIRDFLTTQMVQPTIAGQRTLGIGKTELA